MRILLSSVLLVVAVSFCSCSVVTARKVTLTQFETGEVLQGTVNTISRMITITMPDGEVLQGRFTAQNTVASQPAGIAYALLKSSTSNLMLEISANFEGLSGFGDAQTNAGKKYRVQF